MFDQVKVFFNEIWTWLRSSIFSFSTLIEIIILSVIMYYIMLWFKKTRAWTLLRGILVILVIMVVARIMNLTVISTILESAFSVGIIALLILFQPELRRALDQLGRSRIMKGLGIFDESHKDERFSDETLEAIVETCFELGNHMVGALIIIEQETSINEFEDQSIKIDAIVSAPLLKQIFIKNTPLHDGAALIRGDRVVAAACMIPVLSNARQLPPTVGTRHRAGLGMSEMTDAFSIIVSEETGCVSIALGGELISNLDRDSLRNKLRLIQKKKIDVRRFKIWKGKGNA